MANRNQNQQEKEKDQAQGTNAGTGELSSGDNSQRQEKGQDEAEKGVEAKTDAETDPPQGDDPGKGEKGEGKENKADPDPQYPIGYVRAHGKKEFVKVAPGDWRPVIREDVIDEADGGNPVKVKNDTMKDQKIYGSKGIIVFDGNGIAEVSAREANRLLKIPGYKIL